MNEREADELDYTDHGIELLFRQDATQEALERLKHQQRGPARNAREKLVLEIRRQGHLKDKQALLINIKLSCRPPNRRPSAGPR